MGTKLMIVVALFVSAVLGGAVLNSQESAGASAPVAAGYIALSGGRLYDSRGPSFNLPRLAAGQVVTIATGQPGASAVGVNITLTETVGAGFVAAWASGPWPGTSIMNSSEANENVANFAIIPVAADGTFQLLTQNPAHLIVDIMGFMTGGSPPAPSGLTATITGYSPSSSLTTVVGTVSNGTGVIKDVRVDVRCPNGTVAIDYVFNLPAGGTLGFAGLCTGGGFTSGASVTLVEV
jgi:hypothetical protein